MVGNYSGYFLQGLSSGLQSGFNLGQMKWQQNEKKKLAKKQEEMLEAATIYNSMVAQLGEDGVYSDDDMMKINTAYMALGYDVKERVDGTYKAIQAMNKQQVDQNYQWFEMLPSILEGVDPSDAQGIIDAIRPNISGEKGLLTFNALTEITRKKNEAAQKPKTISPYDFYGQSPADVQGQIAGSVAGQTPGLEGVKFQQPVKAQPTEMDVIGETQQKLDAAYKTGNAPYFNQMAKSLNSPATFETWGQGYEKPGAIGEGGVTPEKFRATSLDQLEDYRGLALTADSLEERDSIVNDYKEAGYDPAPLEEKVTDELWKDNQSNYLATVKKSIDTIIDEKGQLKKGTFDKYQVGVEFDGVWSAEEIYKQLYNNYMEHRDRLEKMGVDVSQFPKIKSLEEYLKSDAKPGKGLFYPSTWFKQKSIYY